MKIVNKKPPSGKCVIGRCETGTVVCSIFDSSYYMVIKLDGCEKRWLNLCTNSVLSYCNQEDFIEGYIVSAEVHLN
jgi:hypothetical protein